jgi:nucleoside-diphosphate-sugar epimerase
MSPNMPLDLDIVTGAFGYTGKYIARRLLAQGRRVRTLTNHPPAENPYGDQVIVAPLDFDHPENLMASMAGADTLYNTYWIRFPRRGLTFEQAVEHSKTLFRAARAAGVRRIVHVSITNPSSQSPLPYFRGKGVLEEFLAGLGVPFAIVRPTVIFGNEDILINNIAWLLQHVPVFAIPGDGDYRIQPVFVEDVADIAVAAAESVANLTADAVGPEVFTFEELVRLIAGKVGTRALILHAPPGLSLLAAKLSGIVLGDVMLTRDELHGLMANLLVSDDPPTGKTRLSDWLDEHAALLGRRYASELSRHYR